MEPIEINAGAYYLRALRCDRKLSDAPALISAGLAENATEAAEYVAWRTRGWADDSVYSWAVCEPTTGEMLAEITLTPGTGKIVGWAAEGHGPALNNARASVTRFAATL